MAARIGVVGAGTMGAGIAQVAAQSGLDVRLYDVAPGPLEVGLGRIRIALERQVTKGKLLASERDAILGRITPVTALDAMADADVVVEAAPEVTDLKRRIFEELDRVCRLEAILATNTSSLSVTEVAAATRRPERVIGMHFFNPVPMMRLVEVVTGARTTPEVAAQTLDLARRFGKTPVQAKDTPGFIVNRIARPFSGEALRIVGENTASARQVDRIARMAAGFRMGPFELMDLVGMDINFAVNKSVFEQFFFEPRFRPHPLQSQMVKAGLLGRKTGSGWYRYENDQIVGGPQGPAYFENPAARLPDLRPVCVLDDDALADLAARAGYSLTENPASAGVIVLGDPGRRFDLELNGEALVLLEASAETVTLSSAGLERPERLVGYGGVPSLAHRQLVEVAPGLRTASDALEQAVAFFHSLGRDTEVVRDNPGLVAPRLIACLVNEAAYALSEGVASATDIDTAMKLGVNYPHGPLEWSEGLGLDQVMNILLDLEYVTGEERYRPCPLIRKLAEAGLNFSDLPR